MRLKTMLATFCACAAMSVLAVGGDATPDTSRRENAPARLGKIVFAGGDGGSQARAVVIKNAKGEADGVAAEYQWLAQAYPGYQVKSQALIAKDGKSYDLIEFAAADGKAECVYFDISAFFGK